MLSRSAARTLSPLSPISSGYSSPTSTVLDPELRTTRFIRSSRKVEKVLRSTPTVDVFVTSADATTPPPTAAMFGFESSIMERLQSALASPFSPKTFARTIISPTHKTTLDVPVVHYKVSTHTDHRVSSLKPRRKNAPEALPLPQPSRLSAISPLSPFRYSFLAARLYLSPLSPLQYLTQRTPLSRLSTMSEAQIRLQKMAKLTRCLGESLPKELVFPSFGQVGEEAEKVSSYLDLYRKHSAAVGDEADLMKVKSPLPLDPKRDWASIDEIDLGTVPVASDNLPKRRTLRRSRSLGDFYSIAEILEMRSPHVTASFEDVNSASSYDGVHPFASPLVKPVEDDEHVMQSLRRKNSIASAKASIIGGDAKHMAEFRSGFKLRPAELKLAPFPPPNEPLPSPPVPSALLAVKSPRVPYWVKPVRAAAPPKTPRTQRTERRQGWGGTWNHGSMGEMIVQLRQM